MCQFLWNILLETCNNYQICTCKLDNFPSKMFTKCFQSHELVANQLCNNLMTECNCIFDFCPIQVKLSDVPKREALFLSRASQMSCVPEQDTKRCLQR